MLEVALTSFPLIRGKRRKRVAEVAAMVRSYGGGGGRGLRGSYRQRLQGRGVGIHKAGLISDS